MSVTENAVVRRTKAADRQTICGRAIEDEKGFAVGFKQVTERRLALSP